MKLTIMKIAAHSIKRPTRIETWPIEPTDRNSIANKDYRMHEKFGLSNEL